MKKRSGEPWIQAAHYGALLPEFTVNLIVRDIDRALAFYRQVLLAHIHYSDPDFAALRVMGLELMLHADHTYEHHPWSADLQSNKTRGLGAELRVLGMNPEELAERAREASAQFTEVAVRGHGWREVMVRDPDGYVWAAGVIQTPSSEPHGR
jgi:catechol 2,3-dioxygenase-like lactoylglutathione lyase family enzyme